MLRKFGLNAQILVLKLKFVCIFNNLLKNCDCMLNYFLIRTNNDGFCTKIYKYFYKKKNVYT